MKFLNTLKSSILLFALSLTFLSQSLYADCKPPLFCPGHPLYAGAFDRGPNPELDSQRLLLDIQANAPYDPALADALMRFGYQMFRSPDGSITHRGPLGFNQVKILFWGQDGTHFAVGGNYPGISGFGGAVQGMAMHHGVEYSLATMNAYFTTIKGQYSSYNAVFVMDGEVRKGSITPNDTWLITNSMMSPMQESRSKQLEWFIRNNPDSLQLIVCFGGASQDAMGSFIERNGGKVGSRFEKEIRSGQIMVPEFFKAYSGGNNEFPVPFSKDGQDLYKKLTGKSFNYTNANHQKEALSFAAKNDDLMIKNMLFNHGGVGKSGLIHPAQLGGYDLDKISINGGEYSRSIKGLTFDDGYQVKRDLFVGTWKHPTFLARAKRQAGIDSLFNKLIRQRKVQVSVLKDSDPSSIKDREKFNKEAIKELDYGVARKLKSQAYEDSLEAVRKEMGPENRIFEKLRNEGRFYIEPDIGPDGKPYINKFHEGIPYEHEKSQLPQSHFMAMMPNSKIGTSANATRGKHTLYLDGEKIKAGANIIVMNDRAIPAYDKKRMDEILLSQPNTYPDNNYMLRRAVTEDGRYISESPISQELYALMKTYDFSPLYKEKEGMTWEKDGINAFYIKSHPEHGDFAHFRGISQSPYVFTLADPEGWDSYTTNRAFTGKRGQFHQGFMDDLGVGDNHAVLSTVPFMMDGATPEEWEYVIEHTKGYVESILEHILKNSADEPVLFLADGENAKKVLERVLTSEQRKRMVTIYRKGKGRIRADNNSGMEAAFNYIKKNFDEFSIGQYKAVASNIPRTHLPIYAPMWWGTTGDTTLNAIGKNKGKVVQTAIKPLWVTDAEAILTKEQKLAHRKMLNYLKKNNLPLPYESIIDFLERQKDYIASVECNDKFSTVSLKSNKKRKITDLDVD